MTSVDLPSDTHPDTLFGIDAKQMTIGNNPVNLADVFPSKEEQPAIVSEPLPEIDPVEDAAMKFTKLLPFVKKFAATMSGKGLSRILHAMAEFPLGASKPRFVNDGERQLFHVMQEIQGFKSTVISDIIRKNAELEQLKQTATELPVAETEITNV